jgi:hypothetical protein
MRPLADILSIESHLIAQTIGCIGYSLDLRVNLLTKQTCIIFSSRPDPEELIASV